MAEDKPENQKPKESKKPLLLIALVFIVIVVIVFITQKKKPISWIHRPHSKITAGMRSTSIQAGILLRISTGTGPKSWPAGWIRFSRIIKQKENGAARARPA